MRPRVDELFHRLADLSPGERARHLARERCGDRTIHEVEELLSFDGPGGDRLTSSIAVVARQAFRDFDAIGAVCGPFRLESVIGRGGMGVVYLAERIDGGIRQQAAVKLLRPGWTDSLRERFLREREILAELSHPNIARLLDAGRLEDGQPYLAMEYVIGRPIDCYSATLTARQKIELLLDVCAAVSYLHDHQILHRDLKPGNILVTAAGQPKLLDFGISKLLDVPGDATATGFRMLTPDYASPEQVSGGPVGKTSDIYSLAIVLRNLLGAQLTGDLEAIVATATRPEPERRYATVEQFADDLRAVLDARPIRARKREWLYRSRNLAARRPLAVWAAACAVTASLAAAGMLRTHSQPPATLALTPIRLTANTAELPVHAAALSPDGTWIAYSDSLGIHLRDRSSGDTRLLPQTAGRVVARWMPDSSSVLARLQQGESYEFTIVPVSGGPLKPVSDPWLYSPDGKRRVAPPRGDRRLVLENADGTASREIWSAPDDRTLNDFIWSPNGEEVAVLSTQGVASTVEVVEIQRGGRSVLVGDDRKLLINGLVWPSPNRIVFSIYERRGNLAYNSNLWEARWTGRPQAADLRKLTAWTDFPILSGSLTTDGKRLLFVRSFTQRDVYTAAIDTLRRRMETPRRLTLDLGDDYPTAWTRDGKSVILTSDRGGESKIYRQRPDRLSAEPVVNLPGKQILPRISPDGRSVLFCSIDPATRHCRLTRAPLAGGAPEFLVAIPDISDFRCSPSGRCIVTQLASDGHIVSELCLDKGIGREIYRDHDSLAGNPDISPDGQSLATASKTTIAIRSFSTGAVVSEIEVYGANRISTLDYAPDGKGFYSGEFRQTEARQLYIDRSGNATLLWRQPGRSLIWGVPSPNGRTLALLMYTTDANVYLLDAL